VKFIDCTATGFGAMRDRSISFAPKFTLVYGPNEAGKSTWHAALYAAFCGMRRSRTDIRLDEDFIRQYRPWDFPGTWGVSTTVQLEDGRRVELQQELVERIECHAIDLDLGRDYSADINNEGCPDGAIWLGLDRRSFIATACIRQSQLLEVLNNPDILQTHLQRAAATCAVNSNGASALQLLENFRAERVGEDRPNSTKPLPTTIRRVETLKRALAVSRTEHARYLELIAAESRGKAKVEKLRSEWNLSRAIIADRDASDWERRLQRILQVIAAHPERPTGDIEQLIELARHVSMALRIWQERPAVPDLSGSTAAELLAEIELLPVFPTGELEPDPKVLKTEAELLASKYALTLHSQAEPSKPILPDTKGLPGEQLRQIAAVLSEPEPEVDPRLEEIVGSTPVSERLIQRVHTAIDVWERRPTFSNTALVRIPPVEEIQRQIEELPVATEGDLQPAREVLDAANRYASSKEAIRQHALNRPPDPVYPNTEVTGSEMRTLAQRLSEPVSTVLDSGIWRRSSLSKEVAALTKSRNQAVMMSAIAGLAALGGSVYFLLDKLAILGILGGVVVVLVAGVGFMKSSAIAAKQKELDNLPKEPDPATLAANAAPNRDLLNRLERLKLPANAEELEKLADQYEGAQVADQMVNLWKETEKRIQALSDKCASELESALYGKVAGYVSNLEEAVAVYQDECAERSRLAAMAWAQRRSRATTRHQDGSGQLCRRNQETPGRSGSGNARCRKRLRDQRS
jgi:flagellar biosynthesis chaperone FliJ